MAGSRVYELIIRNETEERVAEKVGGAGGIQTNDSAGESAGGETSENLNATKALKTLFGYKTIKSYASQVVGFHISTVQLRTGSAEAQQRANFAYNMVQKGVSIAESVIGGLVLSGGNPLGAIAGLTVGLVSTAIDVGQKMEQLELTKRLEDTSRDLSAQRATVSGSRYQNVTQG